MIIPVRCFTCGKVLADKWEYYQAQVDKMEKDNEGGKGNESKESKGAEAKGFEKLKTGKILDDLGLHRMCCRRHMIGHVDLIHII